MGLLLGVIESVVAVRESRAELLWDLGADTVTPPLELEQAHHVGLDVERRDAERLDVQEPDEVPVDEHPVERRVEPDEDRAVLATADLLNPLVKLAHRLFGLGAFVDQSIAVDSTLGHDGDGLRIELIRDRLDLDVEGLLEVVDEHGANGRHGVDARNGTIGLDVDRDKKLGLLHGGSPWGVIGGCQRTIDII